MNVTALLCLPTLHAVRSEHIIVLVSLWRLESMMLPCISEEWRGDVERVLAPIRNAVAFSPGHSLFKECSLNAWISGPRKIGCWNSVKDMQR
jgi:hypothetical protein